MSTLSYLLWPGKNDELVGLGLDTVYIMCLGAEKPYPEHGDCYERNGLIMRVKRHMST